MTLRDKSLLDAGLGPIAGFVAVGITALVCYFIASFVFAGQALAFDREVLPWMRSDLGGSGHAGDVLRSLMLGMTIIGSGKWLACMAAAYALWLLFTGNRALAAALGLGTATSMLLSTSIKLVVDRARPQVVEHLVSADSPSFPSGHAMNSAFVGLAIATLLVRGKPDPARRNAIMAAGMAFTLLVGSSRVYLGVHWPSDVLGGWTLGGLWALLAVTAGSHFQGAGRADPS
jgi:undecaprenyl-diphosphatase